MRNQYRNIGTIEERNKFDGSLIYSGDEFDKKTGRDKYLESRKKDSSLWFVDSITGRLKEGYAQKRPCPLCGFPEFEHLFVKDAFDHVKCNRCSFVFVSPVLTDDAYVRFYENDDRWTGVMLNEEERRINRMVYSYALRFLENENAIQDKKILDIGSGSGYFLEIAREFGWNTKGIELNKSMIGFSRGKNLDVTNDSLCNVRNGYGRFAVITLWYVLEHIKDLRGFMREVCDTLLHGGQLLVAVPQLDALVNRLYGKESATFAGYSHINFFNIDSLNQLVLDYGLELVAAETQITQLNNIKKYFRRIGVSVNSGINALLQDLTPEYIHKNMLGSILVAIYRKTS